MVYLSIPTNIIVPYAKWYQLLNNLFNFPSESPVAQYALFNELCPDERLLARQTEGLVSGMTWYMQQ